MKHLLETVGVAFAALALAGCAVEKYRAAPIAPAATARQLESRRLADPGLRQFVEKNLGHAIAPWPPEKWDLETLTLAAFYFNPQLEIARARAAEASAAILTAGARPNPTLSVRPGVPSPYLFGLDLAVPIETAGKRGIRIKRARRLSEAAKLELATAAWKLRSGVRRALLDHLVATRQLAWLRGRDALLSAQVHYLDERLAVGEIPRPEVDTAKVASLDNRLAIQRAKGRVAETRAALAAAIGVPAVTLKKAQLSWPELDQPPRPESLSAREIQRHAVLDRLDVRRALENYAAAEDSLRLEIARQYPDFDIGPGYHFEEGNNFFTIGFSTTLPIFNRNQGPIAEAEARRKEAAANFLAVQVQGITRSEAALDRYRAAYAELEEAETSLGNLQLSRERAQRHAVALGESDRLALNGILLQGSAAAEAQLNALAATQAALGALEDAVERPLANETLPQIVPPDSPRENPREGEKP